MTRVDEEAIQKEMETLLSKMDPSIEANKIRIPIGFVQYKEVSGIDQFNEFRRESEKTIETILVELSSVRTEQGLLLGKQSMEDVQALLSEWNKLFDIAKRDLEEGSLRMGMRVQAGDDNGS